MGSFEVWALIAVVSGTLKATTGESFPVLLGGVAGGFIGALVGLSTWWSDAMSRTLREFLVQGLEICKLREAYVLVDGAHFPDVALADHPNLETKPTSSFPMTMASGQQCPMVEALRAPFMGRGDVRA
jgi:hypothetical protein